MQLPRLQLAEIEDQPWCPAFVRDAATDYLRFALALTKPYRVIAPRLADAIRRSGSRRVVDLCSGGGGPWPHMLPDLRGRVGALDLCLTDLYPNLRAFADLSMEMGEGVTYSSEPVDATRVPAELDGFRTLFTGLHHLPPQSVQDLLEDAVAKGRGIAACEFTERSLLALVAMLPAPFIVLATMPFIPPVSWKRILFTYAPPVLPIAALYDGVVSCLRTYAPQELARMTARLPTYTWDIGVARVPRTPMRITYLLGTPR